MTPGNKNLPITYREYKFAEEFPILLMEGKSTSPQIDFIHFHNCIEIAFCRKGTMTWNLENRIFSLTPVSYTHLDVYKRQAQSTIASAARNSFGLYSLRYLARIF